MSRRAVFKISNWCPVHARYVSEAYSLACSEYLAADADYIKACRMRPAEDTPQYNLVLKAASDRLILAGRILDYFRPLYNALLNEAEHLFK
jgi:hypothetical protein